MKTSYRQFHDQVIKPLKEWIRRIMNKQDDDDNQFNHPWAIFNTADNTVTLIERCRYFFIPGTVDLCSVVF